MLLIGTYINYYTRLALNGAIPVPLLLSLRGDCLLPTYGIACMLDPSPAVPCPPRGAAGVSWVAEMLRHVVPDTCIQIALSLSLYIYV